MMIKFAAMNLVNKMICFYWMPTSVFTWGRDTLVGLLGTSCYSALVEDKLVEVQ